MVAIKNREMPKNCLMCSEKYDPENRVCGFDGHVFEETFAVVTNKRHHDCPLVEIEERKVEKLEKIEQIVNNYDGSIPSMIKQFSEIQKVLEQE